MSKFTQQIQDPSLVLVQPRTTFPCLTERLLLGRKELNQTKQISWEELSGRVLDKRLRDYWFEPIGKSFQFSWIQDFEADFQ